jgi:hypothetical protein
MSKTEDTPAGLTIHPWWGSTPRLCWFQESVRRKDSRPRFQRPLYAGTRRRSVRDELTALYLQRGAQRGGPTGYQEKLLKHRNCFYSGLACRLLRRTRNTAEKSTTRSRSDMVNAARPSSLTVVFQLQHDGET